MRTLDVINPANRATTYSIVAPGILFAPIVEGIELIDPHADSGSVPVKAKASWHASQSPRCNGYRRRCSARPVCTPHRWGIVLAGGDGLRLRELTQWLCGDDRPKQFCPLLGELTLVEQARERAERSVPADQIIYSVSQAHQKHYLRYLADCPAQRIVQPSNKGTAPAIISALLHVVQTDADAIVAILPCDHYYSDEDVFTAILESAFDVAERRADSIILLGAKPKDAEIEYGWIEIGEGIDGHPALSRVSGFQEKPPRPEAEALFRGGSLWNTFVMVGRARAFLEIASATVPSLVRALDFTFRNSHLAAEVIIPSVLYEGISPVDFSRQVLTPSARRSLALCLGNIEWSDLGNPYRVLVTLLEENGELPRWAKLWLDLYATPRAAAVNA